MDSVVITGLLEALATGDINLRFFDDRSIRVHGQKLRLAALGGIFDSVIDGFSEEHQALKRRKSDGGEQIPEIKVQNAEIDGILCNLQE